MPKIYDEQVDFTTTSVSSNQKNAASIQPIVGGENLWENVLNRTPENLRTRTEALRTAVEDLKYYADYDRAFVLRAEGTTFRCTNETDGYVLTMTGGPLWLYPALTPGQRSGGRLRGARMFVQNGSWLPYAGTLGTNDLSFVATGQYTGMRGYAEADSMAGGTFTVGGNRLMISLVANPAAVGGTISATVTGNPVTLITITYGTLTTPTTINQIKTWIELDLSSQGSYGLAHMIRAVTTSAGTAAPPAITNAVFQGGYDAEAHKIVDFSTFFNMSTGGTFINRLQEGEGLALAFVSGPVEPGTGATGGRRQALLDKPSDRLGGSADNTLSDAILFNTGREPEKIPGSIPIGKLLNGKFVFIDGTTVGTADISLGESGVTLARLAAPTGGGLVGYDGSPNWNADAATNPALISTTVGAALDEIVTRLGGISASDSGARRIGFEGLTGTSSAGNAALNLVAGITSLRQAIAALLNASGATGAPGGVNARVSEYGHRMHGAQPIEKVFSDAETNTGGGELIRAVLNPPKVNLFQSPHVEEQPVVSLLPVYFDNGGGEKVLAQEPIANGATPDSVKLSSMPAAGALHLKRSLVLTDAAPELHTLVQIQGSNVDGFYFAKNLDYAGGAPYALSLCDLTGAAWTAGATLTGAGATITFYATNIEGNSKKSVRVRRTVPGGMPEAHEHIYGLGAIRRGYDRDGILRFDEQINETAWGLNYFASAGNSGSSSLTFSTPSAGVVTVVGLSGMVTGAVGSVGHYLTISGATGGLANLNGTWAITTVTSATEVNIACSASFTPGTQALAWSESRDLARRATNVLTLDDARLLKGIETGTAQDASSNHNHGLSYANVTLPALDILSSGSIAWTTAGTTSVALDDLPDYLNSTQALAFKPSANHTIKGFFLEITCDLTTIVAAIPVTAWDVSLLASPGTTYASTNSRTVFKQSGYKLNPNGTADQYTFTQTVLVPVDSLGRAVFIVGASTLIDTANSFVSVRPTGVVSIRV